MNDPHGVPSPFGIEVVEWFSEGGENLTVRVTGRWRRRRPAWSAQPTLVVEAPGRRYRFPAMPEPPSLNGTPPGKWRISFAVPAALAPELGGRAWLQFGAVAVPLPAAVEPLGVAQLGATVAEAQREESEPIPGPAADEPDGQPGGGGPIGLPPSAEAESEPIGGGSERADEELSGLSVRVETLESELAQARSEAEQLSASLASQQVGRRTAEQRAHSERAQRLELARELTDREREATRARQALGDLATAEERVRGLELELADTRRRIDEAEQTAAAATSARERAERAAAEAARAAEELAQRAATADIPDVAAEHERLGLEHALVARRIGGTSRVPSEPTAGAGSVTLDELPSVLDRPSERERPERAAGARGTAPDRELLAALQAELEQRARTEAALRARLVESETRIAARQLLERQTAATLGQLRDELDGLRGALTRERRGRQAAERHAEALGRDLGRLHVESREANEAVSELRGLIEELRAAAPTSPAEAEVGGQPHAVVAGQPVQGEHAPEPDGADGVPDVAAGVPDGAADVPHAAAADPSAESEPADRLSEALVRLRDVIAPLDAVVSEPRGASSPGVPAAAAPAPEIADRAWLRPVFMALAATDPDRAGRLLVDLLPAQRAVDPTPVAYDVVLGQGRGCRRVTVGDSGFPVVVDGEPRPRKEVDFRVSGEYAALGKLMTAGRLRRRLGWGVARVRGKHARLSALDQLLDTRLGFGGLYQAGVRMQPRTALAVVAGLITPVWTSGVEFVLGYESPPEKPLYLVVADGAPVEVTDAAPKRGVATTISGPTGSLELILAGIAGERKLMVGEEEPLTFLREWINRAQSA